MTSSHSEIDRLMAEADDMVAFGVTIGIDPDDDSEEAQARLAEAWKHHCDQVARNERGVVKRTLEQFDTEDLLRELRLREDVAIASWSVDDLESEIEYRTHHRGLELLESAPVAERAAEIIKSLRERLESAMIESTFEMIADEAEQTVDQFIETGHAKAEESK